MACNCKKKKTTTTSTTTSSTPASNTVKVTENSDMNNIVEKLKTIINSK